MAEDIGFEDKGEIPIPPKGDIRTETIAGQVEKKITREQIEQEIRKDTGTEKEKPKAPIPEDVPRLFFHAVAKFIDCPKMEADDMEARTVAHHLTVILPADARIVSVIVILMVIVNKCVVCMDAIKKKFAGDVPDKLQDGEKPKDLPEQIK